jgi:hypothetical protein
VISAAKLQSISLVAAIFQRRLKALSKSPAAQTKGMSTGDRQSRSGVFHAIDGGVLLAH